ncbi:MAG: hypothetical protein QM657_18445 [Lacrimispora sp.]|uniref:hypothetical protein n=1 Tax=Lacrimispora sp. TaxID=2719234 RepID=UPI0039E4D08F
MKAKRENKVYTITETEKKRYLDDGYDIYGDEGELLEHSPLKKITVAEHLATVKFLKESAEGANKANEALEIKVSELEKDNKVLKEKVLALEKAAKEKAKAGE